MKETINDVIINDLKIGLARAIEIDIEELEECDEDVPEEFSKYSGHKYIAIYEEFYNFGTGITKEDAIYDLKYDFDFFYKAYGCCPDDKLTKSGIEFKKKILEIIGAGEGSIWIAPLRELSYENAKGEIIAYRKNFDHDAGVGTLIEALWLDIGLVEQIVKKLDKEHQFRWY